MRRVLRPVLVVTSVATLFVTTGIATTAGAATAGFGYGTPGFVNSAAPSDLTSLVGVAGNGLNFNDTDFAGEPSIGVNWNTGAALYQADRSTYKVTFDNAASRPASLDTAALDRPSAQHLRR